jgi:hypothetical protein
MRQQFYDSSKIQATSFNFTLELALNFILYWTGPNYISRQFYINFFGGYHDIDILV